jgi:hypothetical protein
MHEDHRRPYGSKPLYLVEQMKGFVFNGTASCKSIVQKRVSMILVNPSVEST